MASVRAYEDSVDSLLDELETSADQLRRQQLCEEIIEATLPVADQLAARYRNRGIAHDDLCQVARAALVRAMGRFRGTGHQSFLAYVVPCIRGELRRHFRDAGWVVRPPRSVQEAQYAIRGVREDLAQELGREPRLEEIAERAGLPHDRVRRADRAADCFAPASLDSPVRDGSPELTVGEATGDCDAGFSQVEARSVVESLLVGLPPRERELVRLRFFDGLTQREVGEHLGISQMQVSRIESRLLRAFRRQLAA